MKKLLLFTILTISLGLNGQSLLTENCTTLTVGNVGSDLTGVTAGQGGWKTLIPLATTGSNSTFQIENFDLSAVYGNAIKITGFNGNAGTTAATSNTRYMSKSIIPQWTSRTAGNDILEVEYDFNTGSNSTSRNSFAIYIFSDEATPRAIAGFLFSKNATINLPSTTTPAQYVNVVRGIALYDNAGAVNTFNFGLGTTTPFQVVSANDTWLKIGFSFNKTTGEIKWKVPSLNINGFVNGAATGLNPGEIDLIGITGGTTAIPNTVAAVGFFDNIVLRASATDTLLGTEQVTLDLSKFSISPNPANDFVAISNSENIKVSSVKITDLNGRVVKQSTFDSVSDISINVSDLSSGIYMMNINSNEGSVTKKIIKN
jgi:Secretion system C-terminal sorting domain